MKLGKADVYNVLVKQVEKQEKKRVASYAVSVSDAMNQAEENLIEAQKQLRRAEEVIRNQKKSLKLFKKTGDVKHLSKFGV